MVIGALYNKCKNIYIYILCNIPINHISEILLPGSILLSFYVLGIKFHTIPSVGYDQICQEDTFERQADLKGTMRPVIC